MRKNYLTIAGFVFGIVEGGFCRFVCYLDRYLSNFSLSCSTCFWVEVFMSSSSLMLNGRVL